MKLSGEVFCKERTYILECLLRQDPDHFLEGDWYDLFYVSTIECCEDGSVQISILVSAIDAVIKGVIGKFINTEDIFETTYKNTPIDKVSLYIQDHSFNINDPDQPIKLKRDVKRIVVKKMREAFERRVHILEAQAFNDQNIYDGNDIIGFR